jgi:hypothetical protein
VRTVVRGSILKAATDQDRHCEQCDCRSEHSLLRKSGKASFREPNIETGEGCSEKSQRGSYADQRKQEIGGDEGTPYAARDIPCM